MDSLNLPESPYRGIEPFRFIDWPIFFAREKETRNLVRQVTIHRGVLLYGNSGVGKSSLINAGFIPTVINENFIPNRLRVQPQPRKEIVVERIRRTHTGKNQYLASSFAKNNDDERRVVFSAGTFRSKLRTLPVNPYPLLIFDQFEEFITLFEEAPRGMDLKKALKAQDNILNMLVDLLRDRSLPVKLLFVFREDYLAKFAKLFTRCPELQDQYVRLTLPRTTALKRIICGPFENETLRGHFGKVFSANMSQTLTTEFDMRADGDAINLSEVQIACLELWRSSNPEEDFERKGIQGLLEGYLNTAMDRLASVNLKDAAVAMLGLLITPSGTRNIISEEELINRIHDEEGTDKEILRNALRILEEDAKLVRRERRYGSYFYEIISEFLVSWISEKKAERLAQTAYRRLEEDEWRKKAIKSTVRGPSQSLTLQESLDILKKGVEFWNGWRLNNSQIQPNFRKARLPGANLSGIDFSFTNFEEVDFGGANLNGANLLSTNLTGANLKDAILTEANLGRALLYRADLRNAELIRADLRLANLEEADLNGANLSYASMVDTNLQNANIGNCRVYGVAAWNLNLNGAIQSNLIITRSNEPTLTVDDLQVAQYFYMFLSSANVRGMINSLTTKAVLILGSFTGRRKAILDALRNKLREYDLLPIFFDFDRPTNKDFTETIKTLTALSYFVIADITNPKSSPLELQATVPNYAIPFVPIIEEGESPFSMMVDLQIKYNWVLSTISYDSTETLIKMLKVAVIDPAIQKAMELRTLKARVQKTISA